MFVNTERLPHVLPPRFYSCPEQHELELTRLFAPGWHLVGSLSDAAHDGDFFTREVMGTPIIVRNFHGQLLTFLNVCPHRKYRGVLPRPHRTSYVFTLRARKETRRSRLLTSAWGRLKTSVIKAVLAEDARLYPDLQRGMKASPFHGTISTQEELVYAFQDYVQRGCGS